MPRPEYYCSLTTALLFTQLQSTSPTFSDISQELETSSMSSNLENQLADAMMVIQTLMTNKGNLTQQVVHLMQNMAYMQTAQNVPQPSPNHHLNPHLTISLYLLHHKINLYNSCLCLLWPRTKQHLYLSLLTPKNQRLPTPSPFLEKGMTQNLSSMDAAYILMVKNQNFSMRMWRFIGFYHICRLDLPRPGTTMLSH